MLATEVPISRTKITLPRRRLDLFSRARLLDILNERLDRRLIIISAAAGYGKTSLLIDLAHQSEVPFCWLSLDSLDRDPQRFIAGFIAAIAESFPEFGRRSRLLLNALTNLDEGLEPLLVTLINEIYDDIPQHFVLVLDDFHVLDEDQPVLNFVNRFVELVGENCHLVLASRTLPELREIPLLVARDEVGGLDYSDLAFEAKEIQDLLAQNRQIHLSDEDAQKLLDATEGWITGLQFTDISQLVAGAEAFRMPHLGGVTVFDYLGQQVLEQQSSELQEFLLRSSLLEEFDVTICEAVLGPMYEQAPDWSKLLGTLVQRNLFTLPVGTDGRWLRYHHLFRDYLQARLQRDCAGDVRPILRRLAAFHEAESQWEKAYQIYKQLEDTEALATLVERAGIPMYQHAILTLDSWLKALPPSVVNSRPGLLSLRGNTEVMKGNAGEGVRLFDRAISMYRKQQHGSDLALALVRRGGAYRFLGKYEQAIRDANEVLGNPQASDDLEWIHADALRIIGLSFYRQGRTQDAINYLQQALEIYMRVQDTVSVPLLLMETGLALSTLGNHAEAKVSYEKALKIWKDEGNLISQASLLNNYGFLHQQLGEYEQAAQTLEEGLLCARRSGAKRIEALISLSLGDVYSDVEDHEIAAQTYRQASDLVDQLGDTFQINYLNMATANLALLRGDAPEARRILVRSAAAIHASDSKYEYGLFQLLNGRLELLNGRLPKAISALKDAADCFKQDGRETESLWSAVWLAAAEYESGKHAAARGHILAAMPNTNQIGHAAVLAARQARAWLTGLRRDPELRSQLRSLFDKADRLEEQLPPIRRQLRRLARTIEMPTPSLIIRGFGPGQVSVDGRLLSMSDWQTQSVRELFFFFLAASRPITREQIGNAMWPGTEDPAKFKMRFKNEIYRLRHAVGQETILFDGETYAFNATIDHEYDVEAFEAYVTKAKSALKASEAMAFYERALRLVQGRYLEDIGASWILPEQERLHQVYLSAAVSLAVLYQKDGQLPKAIESCQRTLEQDNTSEAIYRLLMEIYNRMGDRASVVHVYHLCEKALLEMFHMPPSEETRELYRRLTS